MMGLSQQVAVFKESNSRVQYHAGDTLALEPMVVSMSLQTPSLDTYLHIVQHVMMPGKH